MQLHVKVQKYYQGNALTLSKKYTFVITLHFFNSLFQKF